MRRRVVVTGMGAVTPIGRTIEEMWKSLREGKSGIGLITHFDASHFPTKFAAEVKDFDLGMYVEDPKRFQYSGRNIRFAVGAAKQAMDDSGILDSKMDPSRLGIYLGAGEGQQDFHLVMGLIAESQHEGQVNLESFTRAGLQRLHAQTELEQ